LRGISAQFAGNFRSGRGPSHIWRTQLLACRSEFAVETRFRADAGLL